MSQNDEIIKYLEDHLKIKIKVDQSLDNARLEVALLLDAKEISYDWIDSYDVDSLIR